MMLTGDVELIEGLPVAHIRSIGALAVSDLHLGYEGALAKNGVFLPNANLRSILDILSRALSGRQIEKLIVVGDIKNEFSGVENAELNELNDLLSFLKSRGVSLILIKGNHDNFIESYSKHLNITVHRDPVMIGTYLFVHGDKKLPATAMDTKPLTLIIGHEHPSIGIPTKIRGVERLRCFLYGDYKENKFSTKILVLPAIGYFETGIDINLHRSARAVPSLLGPKAQESLTAIAIGYGSTINFGKVGKLRRLA
jgi:putative SbcD/Mre11-related phosphoesterase